MNLTPLQLEILDYIRTPKSCYEVMNKFGYNDFNALIDDLIYLKTPLYRANDEYISKKTMLQATPLAFSIVESVCNDNRYKRNTFIVALVAAIISILSFIASVLFGLLGLLNS